MPDAAGPVRPFTLAVPEAEVDDLRRRLAAARWPDVAPGHGWPQGTDRDRLAGMVEHWRTAFDWRVQGARLNALPNIVVPVDDIDLHALHVPGRGPAPLPLLLAHGWPGSVVEFLDIVPRLTDPARFGGDPADAFTVVAPSLPGFPLSFRPGQRRLGIADIAAVLARAMTALGYERFGMQGGDWGSLVGRTLAATAPERVFGDLRRWTVMPRGGHFAAMQCPDLLAREIRDFFRPLR